MVKRLLALAHTLAIVLILPACAMPSPFSSKSSPGYSKIATNFASALVEGDLELAYSFLTPKLQQEISPGAVQAEFEAMYSGYSDNEPTHIHFDPQFTMTDWPGKQPNDVGWVYVSIMGEDFVEAVAVVISEIEGELLISYIEWGRP